MIGASGRAPTGVSSGTPGGLPPTLSKAQKVPLIHGHGTLAVSLGPLSSWTAWLHGPSLSNCTKMTPSLGLRALSMLTAQLASKHYTIPHPLHHQQQHLQPQEMGATMATRDREAPALQGVEDQDGGQAQAHQLQSAPHQHQEEETERAARKTVDPLPPRELRPRLPRLQHPLHQHPSQRMLLSSPQPTHLLHHRLPLPRPQHPSNRLLFPPPLPPQLPPQSTRPHPLHLAQQLLWDRRRSTTTALRAGRSRSLLRMAHRSRLTHRWRSLSTGQTSNLSIGTTSS